MLPPRRSRPPSRSYSSLPKRKTWLKRSTKPIARSAKRIRSVNPVAKAKRDKLHAKDRRSPHTKEIERQARERAGNQCELVTKGGGILEGLEWRCGVTEGLELHHDRYPKTRPLAVTDVRMLCDPHHNRLEAMKLHKMNRRGIG
jgi:hypothetical protein